MKHGFFAFLFILAVAGAACSDDDNNTADQLPDLGKTWTRLPMPSSFSNRTSPGVAVQGGRLYVAAGSFSPDRGDDCWSTANGTVWTLETNDLGVSGLRNFAMTAHEGKLWIYSGVDSYGGQQWYSRSSADGRIWAGHALDQARYFHAMASFNGRLWAVGGFIDGILTNAVTWSTNGIDWHAAPAPGFAPRLLPGLTVHNGRLWVSGGNLYTSGSINDGPHTNDVWSTADGLAWTCATPSAPFSPRSAHGFVTAGNRLYVVGGTFADQYGNRVGTNDIWKSYDGITWEQVAVSTPFQSRHWHGTAAFDNGLYVIAGAPDGSATNDIWYSK